MFCSDQLESAAKNKLFEDLSGSAGIWGGRDMFNILGQDTAILQPNDV